MPTLTPLEVAQEWVGAGGPASVVPQAVAYAWIESGYSTTAVSPTGCCDLWQLCPCVSGSGHAQAAVAKWKACNGGSFACDWTPYDFGPANPGWAKGYADGVKAQAELGSNAGPTDTSGGTAQPTSVIGNAISSATSGLSKSALGAVLALLGLAIVGVAVWIAVSQTDVGRQLAASAKRAVATAAVVVK